ncbi:hypothetical protein EJB05_21133, partial [Eragrostis curvula]
MSGRGNPSGRVAGGSPDGPAGGGGSEEPSDPPHAQHGGYVSNGGGGRGGGAGAYNAQRAGYPYWYVGSGDESGATGGDGSMESFNLHSSYNAGGYGVVEEHGFPVDRYPAAGMSLGGVYYGDGGWYWNSGGTSAADSNTVTDGYGTDFFYENGGGSGAVDWQHPGYGADHHFFYENGGGGNGSESSTMPLQQNMYLPQQAQTGYYWPTGGNHRDVDQQVGAAYEPRHARTEDHRRDGAVDRRSRFDDAFHGNGDGRGVTTTFPSPSVRAAGGMHAPRYYYAPNGARHSRSRSHSHIDDIISNSLRSLTVADVDRRHRRRFSEFSNQRRALIDAGDQLDALSSPVRGISADQYDGMRLEDVRGRMCSVASSLPGCQFLARMVDDGGAAAARQVFEEVAGEVVRFMGHSPGHVLVETLAKFWTDEEVIRRVLGVLAAANPVQILAAARNHAGSSILQTLIGRIAGQRGHVESFTRTLAGVGETGVLSLIQDMSGSQLILKCLDRFSADQNQFITDVVVKCPHRVCLDRHGCHVFTRCIDMAGDEQTRASLVRAVCRDGLALAEHGAGNYVVQHVIEAAAPWAKDGLHRAFRGRYASLARQKASSHVVQRCLQLFSREKAEEIVWELLSCEWHCTFRDLISDPYANYVVQTAMERTEGQMHRTLLNAIGRYKDALAEDRFAKQVFQKFCTLRRSSYW